MKRIKNLSTSCTSCTLNSHEQLHRCCLYGIHKRTNESSHRGKHIALAVLRTHRNRVRLECDSPNSRSRDPSSPALESFLERWSCALAHGGDQDTDSWDMEDIYYYYYVLICSVVGSGVFSFFLSFIPPLLSWLLLLLLALFLFRLLGIFFLILLFLCFYFYFSFLWFWFVVVVVLFLGLVHNNHSAVSDFL